MVTSEGSGQSSAASNSLRQVMREHPLFFFFFMAYAFSWIILIPYVLSAWGIIAGDFTFTFALHTFGPALAAIIMISVIEGKAGLLRLRSRIRQWRAGWQWYLFILVGIPALLLLGIIIQPGTLASFQGLTPVLLVSYPVTFVVVFFGGGPLGEEIGWRGFALPRMQPRYGPLWGTLLLGVLWVFWHLADFLTPVHGGFLTNFPIFFLMVMALAIIFTWVFNHTRGSIFICYLVACQRRYPGSCFGTTLSRRGPDQPQLAALIGFGVPALLILILTRGRLGYQPLPSPQSSEP